MLLKRWFFILFLKIIIISCLLQQNNNLNISYDHRAILINGKRKLLISGSIHYPRSTPSMWPELFKRSKDAGIDLIETYVFWNLHEKKKGDDINFKGYADIKTFLDLAKSNGLFVNLRIGPYICAEWNYGGFPEWLKEIPGIVFRDYNKPFMDEMEKWTKKITEILKPWFAINGGPIILAQIENEYGLVEKAYGKNGTLYAKWAVQLAKSLKLNVPWTMCAQDDMEEVINTCNSFYCDNWLSSHFKKFPNQPGLWTENWPGWFTHWGEPLPTRPTEDVAFAVATWFAKGGTFHNYYMWHGGTTFDRWVGGPWIITSYDYDVALDEYGYPNEPKYSHLKNLHFILHKYEDVILYNEIPKPIILGKNQEAYIYKNNSNYLIFLINSDSILDVTISLQGKFYKIPKWSVTLIGDGIEIFNTAIITSQKTFQYFWQLIDQPLLSKESKLSWWPEKIGIWKNNTIESTYPLEQISITHDETDYLWYETKIITIRENIKLSITNAYDYLHIFIDGKYQASMNGPNITLLIQTNSPGSHTLSILSMTMGLVNYGTYMERYQRGLLGTIFVDDINIRDNYYWKMQPELFGEYLKIYTQLGSRKVTWNENIKEAIKKPFIWYKLILDAPEINKTLDGCGTFALDLNGMNKGFVWVNGNGLGRYWLIKANTISCKECNYAGPYDPSKCRINCKKPTQRYYHVPIDWLKWKDNLIILFEEIGGDPLSVKLVERKGGIFCGSESENNSLNHIVSIQCPPKTYITNIDFASFGTPLGQCGSYQIGNCHAKNSTDIVEKLCLNKSICNVPINTHEFGDPCPNIFKTLAIQIFCN